MVDASAIVSIIKGEPERERFSDALTGSRCVLGAPSLIEVKIALSTALPAEAIDRLVHNFFDPGRLQLVGFTPAMADVAVLAFRTYGKGRGHPAQLNYGDCMAYAVAKVLDAKLLYKGDDFARTDIRSALAP